MTVEEVARRVLANIDSDANFLQACTWVSDRYRQLCSRARLRHLRRIGELSIDAPVSTGTLAVVQGSATMTAGIASPATLALIAEGDSLRGKYIRCATAWHRINDFAIVPTGFELHLDSPYTEDSNAAASYRIVDRFKELDTSVRWISQTMVCMRRRTPVEMSTQKEIDLVDPSRVLVLGYGPTVWCEIGSSEKGAKLIEFYPFSERVETIHFVYWPEPPVLKPEDDLPPGIDAYALTEGAMIDAMRYEAAKATRAGNNDSAALWTNAYRSQSTQWERIILDVIRTDRGVDDLQFILRTTRYRYPGTAITNARDEIFARGIRP